MGLGWWVCCEISLYFWVLTYGFGQLLVGSVVQVGLAGDWWVRRCERVWPMGLVGQMDLAGDWVWWLKGLALAVRMGFSMIGGDIWWWPVGLVVQMGLASDWVWWLKGLALALAVRMGFANNW